MLLGDWGGNYKVKHHFGLFLVDYWPSSGLLGNFIYKGIPVSKKHIRTDVSEIFFLSNSISIQLFLANTAVRNTVASSIHVFVKHRRE